MRRPHTGKLLEIVIHMLRRGDENATTLLHTITDYCLSFDQILVWWYQGRVTVKSTSLAPTSGAWAAAASTSAAAATAQAPSPHSQAEQKRVAAYTLSEEIVRLWRLAALNPRLSAYEREQLAHLFRIYHNTAITRIGRMLKVRRRERKRERRQSAARRCRARSPTRCFTADERRPSRPPKRRRSAFIIFPAFFPRFKPPISTGAPKACGRRAAKSAPPASSLFSRCGSKTDDRQSSDGACRKRERRAATLAPPGTCRFCAPAPNRSAKVGGDCVLPSVSAKRGGVDDRSLQSY